MSTVGESQDPPWKDVLYTKGLSAAATILEEYGLSCESDMSLVDEDDLVVLCSKLKPFQSKLLRKWVQGLGAEQRAAAFMKDASAAKNHSTSPPLEDKGAEDEDEEENGDEDADADEGIRKARGLHVLKRMVGCLRLKACLIAPVLLQRESRPLILLFVGNRSYSTLLHVSFLVYEVWSQVELLLFDPCCMSSMVSLVLLPL